MRECTVAARTVLHTGKVALVVHLDPPVVGQGFGTGEDLTEFVLVPRFEGATMSPTEPFPWFVHIALPYPPLRSFGVIAANRLQSVAWGELYRSEDDARTHRFD